MRLIGAGGRAGLQGREGKGGKGEGKADAAESVLARLCHKRGWIQGRTNTRPPCRACRAGIERCDGFRARG